MNTLIDLHSSIKTDAYISYLLILLVVFEN